MKKTNPNIKDATLNLFDSLFSFISCLFYQLKEFIIFLNNYKWGCLIFLLFLLLFIPLYTGEISLTELFYYFGSFLDI